MFAQLGNVSNTSKNKKDDVQFLILCWEHVTLPKNIKFDFLFLIIRKICLQFLINPSMGNLLYRTIPIFILKALS